MCCLISAGGLNLIQLQKWNQAAVAKLCWDLAHKEDKLWIKWIHTYYIKDQQLGDCVIPQQASWMTKKILASRYIMLQSYLPSPQHQSMIRTFYLQLIGDLPRVQWKCLKFGNKARPKACFVMWLCLQQRLLTADRLLKWDIEASPTCVMCQQDPESHEHLFVTCTVAKTLWAKVLRWSNNQLCIATTWNEFVQWGISSAKGKAQQAQLFKMVFAECTYALWTERNQRLFESTSRHVDQLAKDLAVICTVRVPPGLQTLIHSFQF
ncbi:uncharacterized protein LOC132644134 [Lycium barbarum]|uniref:uncharacterized protein LOC132644134 n=1 Tax=Lycium barbarum TaxID=112863 RepID=UPI00293EC92F|nr:uncharacterized protein LOC132644134 [Lycium barbarum]